MPTLRRALGGVLDILADGVRVLTAHWPQLVGLFLLGWAGRMAVLWMAVLVSDVSPTFAVLMLPLAPMCTLVSLVMMLRVAAETLPAFRDLFEGVDRAQRVRSGLQVVAQVLLPFLAVYASQGLLADDTRLFLYDSTADEWVNSGLGEWNFGRADYADGVALIAMIVVAIALRKAISLLQLGKRALVWSFIAAYLEVLWLVTLARSLQSQLQEITDWVTSRRIIDQLLQWWNALIESLPHIGGLTLIDFIGGLLASAGNLVVVPVAWLAIGAAVYGAKLSGRDFETPEQVTERLNRIPSTVRRVVAHTVEPVTSPVKDAWTALGKVATAGVVPMALFCLVFVIASQVKVGIAWVFHAAVGARDPWLVYALDPYSVMLQRLGYFVLSLALLSGAVNAVVLGQRDSAAKASDAQDATQTGIASTA